MELHLDPKSSLPIYAQLVDRVKHMVATGNLKPGDQLPTVRQLGVDLRVNPNTIARAYTELAHQGIISSQQGKGTYVADQPNAAALSLREDRLRAVVSNVVLEVLSLGYEPRELQDCLQDELNHWQRANGPPLTAVDTK
jgi:GntR family transcriptional regulator